MHGLNLTVPEDAQRLIKPWDERNDTTVSVESNVDDEVRGRSYSSWCGLLMKEYMQLIIHVPFTQNVRIRSILLKLGECSTDMLGYSVTYVNTGRGEVAPRHLQIYVNHNTIVDFAEAEAITPQLNITLQEGEVGVVEYPLRAATFANVHSLSLYFVRARCASAALLSADRWCMR